MAIRFASFETYKGWLANKSTGHTNVGGIFIGVYIRIQPILIDLAEVV
jgi:hypothetical protein